MAQLRTLFLLGRVSNIPTVWSNCLAGWILGGAGDPLKLVWVGIGASFLYIGGMFLNDAFDAEFDRQHRAERPIPSGIISAAEVWILGFGWMTLGLGSLLSLGISTTLWGTLLAACIILYDSIHKIIAVAPVLMATCRFLLYLVAASAGVVGITGMAIWGGLALGFYIVGVSYLARRESTRGPFDYWPLLFLAAPIVLALLVNSGPWRKNAVLLGAVVALWFIWSLRTTLGKREPNIGHTVAGLLAGIVLLDMLAVLSPSVWLNSVFLLLFGAARVLQRFVPAT